MNTNDILVVSGLAAAAILITIADLLLSLIRHLRSSAAPDTPETASNAAGRDPTEAASLARRDAIRRRLAAIQSAAAPRPPAPTPQERGA